jgi:hypothetical protein
MGVLSLAAVLAGGPLSTLCIIVAVIGLLFIVLGLVPMTAGHIGNSVGIGMTLLILGIVLYVILALVGA